MLLCFYRAGKKAFTWLESIFYLQLALIMLSLPILIAWGMPFSLLSPIGNIIFAPFLIAFLCVSSIIFISELFQIPSSIFVMILEYITSWWISLVAYGNPQFLVALPCPSPFMLIGMFIFSWIILRMRKLIQSSYRVPILTFIIFFMGCTLHLCSPKKTLLFFERGKKKLLVIHKNTKTIIIDPGIHGPEHVLRSWIYYTVLPALRKKIGSDHIDYIILCKPTASTLHLVKHLLHTSTHVSIVIPYRKKIETMRQPLSQYCSEHHHMLKALDIKRLLILLKITHQDRAGGSCLKSLASKW